MRRIIDANYEKADLNKVMTEQCQHVNTPERYRLLNILKKSEYLFDGTLGMWNTTPIDLELKDDAKPVCSRTYPVPRVHEAMFRKAVYILVSLGVLEEENDSERGAPFFAQPKAKINRVRFLSDLCNFNSQLKSNP